MKYILKVLGFLLLWTYKIINLILHLLFQLIGQVLIFLWHFDTKHFFKPEYHIWIPILIMGIPVSLFYYESIKDYLMDKNRKGDMAHI